jgi:hypothetical protein
VIGDNLTGGSEVVEERDVVVVGGFHVDSLVSLT